MRPLHILLLAMAAGSLAVPSSAAAVRSLEVGLTDGVFSSADAGTRDVWFDRALDARSDLILLGAAWRGIAPANPAPGFDARDPDDPRYNWGQLDASLADALGRGFKVAVLVTGAPAFAEGPNKPGNVADGTWKPKPKAVEDFGHAIAERYDGTIRSYQLWAEPNLETYLTPQFSNGTLTGAVHYRKMLRSFNRGIKSVDPTNYVVTGGTAPYGDPIRGGRRTQPVKFWRKVLCLRGGGLEPTSCPGKASFDALAHHPINVGAPTRHALNRADVSTPDIGKLKAILRKAERKNRVGGPRRHAIWATEIWWDSKPPDPDGVPQARHARWLSESFFLLWKQGVSKVVWFQIRDQAEGPGFALTPQTGLFEIDGTEKTAFKAFRFPFVANGLGKGRVRVWGLAPGVGQVVIERRHNGAWRTAKRLHAPAKRIFSKTIKPGPGKLRARFGAEASIAWSR